MSTVQEIEQAIRRLPAADVRSLARWMEDYAHTAVLPTGSDVSSLRDEASEWAGLSATGLQRAFDENEPEFDGSGRRSLSASCF